MVGGEQNIFNNEDFQGAGDNQNIKQLKKDALTLEIDKKIES